MSKLPTTFAELDLTGFVSVVNRPYTCIDQEMVNFACAVLQKNRIGIVTRSVQAALKHIYGIGGSADTICQLLKQWRSENLAALKQGKGEKDLVSAILEATDDGLIEESDVPPDYLTVMRQMAIAGYKLAYQKADTSVSGDRMKILAAENDLMRQQMRDFPQLQLELNFYKAEYERQRNELREAYMNLNKQQLADSDDFRASLDALHQERNDLIAKLDAAEKQLATIAESSSQLRDRSSEIARLNGQLEAREREISSLHDQIDSLHTSLGEKQVTDAQLEQMRSQMRESSETIVRLQSQISQQSSALQVDVDVEGLQAANESLAKEVKELHHRLASLQPEVSEPPATRNGKKLAATK